MDQAVLDISKYANQIMDRCDSTNDLARALGEAGYPHGTWVSARTQTSGRGRQGNKWESPAGNLFLSFVARIDRKELWTWVPLAAALSVTRTLGELFPNLPVQIKWPNDLWVHQEKIAGILCEAQPGKIDSFIVIGIGLNCASAPAGLTPPATSLSKLLSPLDSKVDADDIRPVLLERIRETLQDLESHGPDAILREYEKCAALPPGTEIRWNAGHGLREGCVQGIGSRGELLVKKSSGETTCLLAEDVKIRGVRKEGGEAPA